MVKFSSGQSPSMASAKIKPELHKLIHDLVVCIHKNEPGIEKGILVFLPTYYDLDRLWHLLKPLRSFFKVILATNIAESSVTIPKVAYVINSCRSLQVFWDSARKIDSAELVWVSKSQAEKWGGRTGRTCDGHVYRLVTRPFFSNCHCDNKCLSFAVLNLELLMIPTIWLWKALDPPDPDVVEDALDLLVHVKALEKISPRGHYEPTFYGRLLASFALSFDASVLVLKFGDAGFLHEGILLGIFMDIQPLPILRPSGEEHKYTEFACRYYGGDCNTTVKIGRKEMVLVGNLCAYQFWQRVFKDNHQLEHLKQVLNFGEENGTTLPLPEIEEQWCSFHNLVQSSLHHISEICMDINLCMAWPKTFQTLLKRVQYAGGTYNQLDSGTDGGHVNGEASVCVGQPMLIFSFTSSKKPSCKFFFSLQGCRNGESCSYSHDQTLSVSSSGIAPCLPEDDDVDAASLLQFFPISGDGCILLLDDTDLHFSSKIAQHYDPSKIISTTCLSETSIFDPSLTGVRILWGLHHPYDTIVSKAVENPIPWSKVKCVLWFPNLDGYSENLERQKPVVWNFFEYLEVRILADSLYAVQSISQDFERLCQL
ncbi:hypothetical protein Tsubulata_017179 [Turnera subulata]|uniref:RNA helicase n=1 Tax=Turnera subulata TaxID=218843 RepID=A0A9Q0GHW8_9ROSI|nr:hypothetical protein Tsubulata_017179 [Turnera subulata]